MGKKTDPWNIGEEEHSGSIAIPIVMPSGMPEVKPEDVAEVLPLFPMRNNVLFPGTVLPLFIKRESTKRLLREMSEGNAFFIASLQKNDAVAPSFDEVHNIGTLAKVLKVLELPDGSLSVLLHGFVRMEILSQVSKTTYMTVKASMKPEVNVTPKGEKEYKATCGLVKDIMMKIVKVSNMPPDASVMINNMDGAELINNATMTSPLFPEDKQAMLKEDSLVKRGKALVKLLKAQLQIAELKNEIQRKALHEMDQQQKDFLLHQEMKVIQMELGDDKGQVIDSYRSEAQTKLWPADVADVFDKELDKLSRMNQNAPEYSMTVEYIENMLALPWMVYSKDNFNIQKAERRLNADHYGLDKVKDRILEHLAVLKLKGDMKSPIMCLYGPPGVGKTSLGKSIAESLGRQYVRISLGGLHDESEIRGHRRTYLGSMMGRIMQGIKKAGTSNPVFVLDEIDKITKDIHGDPEAALLEVLDPEQNNAFHDNFLNVDYDLSKVMFIATANAIGGISQPLKDRMEMIEVSGYLAEEKVEIASRHLLPKEMENAGIDKKAFSISKPVMKYIIDRYTRESGVRELDKTMASICRKMALKIAKGEAVKKNLSMADVRDLLGIELYSHDEWEDDMKPGVVTGLAWTAVGGEILFVESSACEGKGKLSMTGNLGDVMKESATLALEYIRANAALLGVEGVDFDKTNIHVHVPEGAVPKDGPSAGITMVTSMVSALTGRRVKKRLAMTGEISLRGAVLPVGGIREKILAAKRAGIKEIILSEPNRKDLSDIKDTYIEGLTFHHVKTIAEVVELALEK
ncbi:MAG: endopeptidase La [Bacteroidales bacterium]|nr:endopeptidase La [Bacteroidales bacterium]